MIRLLSPVGHVEFQLITDDPRPQFSVTYDGKPVIETSPMAFTVDGVDLAEGVEITGQVPFEVNETYPWRGAHSLARNRCSGMAVSLRHRGSGAEYRLEVRVFHDGAAFRWIVPGGAEARVPDEATRFILPAGSTVWHHDFEGHYEGVHEKKEVDDVREGEWAAPPLTFRLPWRHGYAAITEAALVNFSGMGLQADGRRGFSVRLGHQHPPSYPFTLRYGEEEARRLSVPAAISGEIASPWRVVMVGGAGLSGLVTSDIIHNLCPPPDARLFPQGFDTDWIRSGRAVWKYLDGGENTLEEMKEFTRLAGALGFEHHVVEGFWRQWTDDEVRELVECGRQHGVGIWLWQHSKELRDPEARGAFFQRCRDLGAAGVKLDFFDHEAKEIIDFYQALLRETAEHRLMVNFHGANKPTGEPRTWPHELTREAVKGMEYRKLQERARHDTTLPFTRLLAGHADYTPVLFGERRGDTTWAHQIASAVILGSSLLTYAAHPLSLLEHPAAEIIRSIPAVWDETVVLPLSEVGEVAAFARRAGDTWLLALLNGPEARSLVVPLPFLGPGEYRGTLVRDSESAPDAVEMEGTMVRRGDILGVELRAGGGFVTRLRPADAGTGGTDP